MDFYQAQQRRLDLDRKLKAGELSRDAYQARVQKLLVIGTDGIWWKPNDLGAGWLSWNNSQWLPGTPAGRRHGEEGPDTPLGRALRERAIFLSIGLRVPLRRRSQEWWDFCSIIAGCAGAIIWFLFSWLGTRAPDFATPVLIAGMPPVLVYTRPVSDPFLVPFKPVRDLLQPAYRVTLGIAAPFIVSFLLATFLKVQGYSLAGLTLVIGGILSYALMRDPEITDPGAGTFSNAGIVGMVVVGITCIAPVMASSTALPPCPDELFCATGAGVFLAGIPPAVISFLLCARLWVAAGESVAGSGSTVKDLDLAFRKKVAGLRSCNIHVIPVQDLERDWPRVALNLSFWDERKVLSAARAGASGLGWSQDIIQVFAGKAGELGTVIMSRKPPLEPSDLAGWMQTIVEYNHDATRVVLDDGSRLVLDYWSALAGKNDHVIPEPEWVDSWNAQAGQEMIIKRTADEENLKKYIEMLNEPGGVQAFRTSLASAPAAADLWIRSWEWSRW